MHLKSAHGSYHAHISTPTKKNKCGACIVISWHCDVDWFVLRELKHDKYCMDPQYAEGGDCTMVCFSIYRSILDTIHGSALDAARLPIQCVGCRIVGDEFQIYIKTSTVVTGKGDLKKILKNACAKLNPGKLSGYYSEAVRKLGGKYNKATFLTVAKEVAASLKKQTNITCSGSFNGLSPKAPSAVGGEDDEEDAAGGTEELAKLLMELPQPVDDIAEKGDKLVNKHHTFHDSDLYTEVKSAGLSGACLASYLMEYVDHGSVANTGKTVIVFVPKA
jgi:hypothetical protein